ncbi:UNVERIFIED_CONTAM: hypothetical protein FKN15_027895 [Acipenser sinensis]
MGRRRKTWEEPEHLAPEWEEPERPAPEWEEPERPAPEWEEPERPKPKRGESVRTEPKRGESVRPEPKRGESRSVTASDDQQPGSPVSHPGRDSRVQDGSMTTFIGVSFTLGFLPTTTLDTRSGSVLRLLLLPGTSLHT